VAELEYEIAQKNVGGGRNRMKSGSANLHDLDNARSQSSEKLIALQDVTFELERNQGGTAAFYWRISKPGLWVQNRRIYVTSSLSDDSFAPFTASKPIFNDEPA